MPLFSSKEGSFYYYNGLTCNSNYGEFKMIFNIDSGDRHLLRALIRKSEWKSGAFIDVVEIGVKCIFGRDQEGDEKCYPIGGFWEYYTGLKKPTEVSEYKFPHQIGDKVKLSSWYDSSVIEIKYIGQNKFFGVNQNGEEYVYSFGKDWNWVNAVVPLTLPVGCCFSIASTGSTERNYFKVKSWSTHPDHDEIVYICSSLKDNYSVKYTLSFLKQYDFRLEEDKDEVLSSIGLSLGDFFCFTDRPIPYILKLVGRVKTPNATLYKCKVLPNESIYGDDLMLFSSVYLLNSKILAIPSKIIAEEHR